MCGRFSLTATPEEVCALFDFDEIAGFPPRYNIAPTQPILTAMLDHQGNRSMILVRWGLIPQWVKDPDDFTLLINARSETVAAKASFKSAIRHSRILIPASGFYEWYRPVDKKQPKQAYWITPASGNIVAFGGLMETWTGADGTEIDTGCILTTASNSQIGNIHHRMPVVIKPEDFDLWLDCQNNGPKEIAKLMEPIENGFFNAIAVSDRVNKVANNGPDIQQPAPQQGSARKHKPDHSSQMDLF